MALPCRRLALAYPLDGLAAALCRTLCPPLHHLPALLQVGGFKTYVASESVWTVTKAVEDAVLTLRIGAPPINAKYTVQVRAAHV